MRTRLCDAPDLHSWIVEHDPLPVVPLRSSGREQCDVRGAYVDRYWLPILGPSCVLALRRLADALDRSPDGLELPLAPFARSIGLGAGIRRGSPIVRTLARLDDFGFAHAAWDHYAVRLAAPALSRRQLRLLPDFLAELHRRETESPPRPASVLGIAARWAGPVVEAVRPTSARSSDSKEAR